MEREHGTRRGEHIMPDFFATITEAPPAALEMIADFLEQRAALPPLRAMLESYLAEIVLPPDAQVLEVGCGTGAITRVLAARPGVVAAVGVDLSVQLIAKARELSTDIAHLVFQEGDGHALPFSEASFDLVVFHTTLIHAPDPARMLAEAYRVLRSGGWLAVFEPDATTRSVAIGDWDPLEACRDAHLATGFQNPWLVRELSALVRSTGFDAGQLRSHGHIETSTSKFMISLGFVDVGADWLAATSRIGPELAAALKAEARRRIAAGTYCGFLSFASLIARKPGQ
jgi:ubiquinone/menaquinone biosynthesis C-methylase UbiE